MEESLSTAVESRIELMVSSTDQANPTLRTAHFLKPSVTSSGEKNCNLSSLSLPSLLPTFDPQKWPLAVNFHGWRNPQRKWKEWVKKMLYLHETTWRKAGIREAILNSTYTIHNQSDLVLGLAERWCPETKSFIFPWGEATVTLEDMMISGYSLLGCPVFEPFDSEELKGIEKKLIQVRLEMVRSQSKKAPQGTWLNKFMDSGTELEHEAFIALWLSRFVLPSARDVICENIFPIAVHLTRGTRIALAPAVLAGIYRDLNLLKETIVALATSAANSGNVNTKHNNDESNLAATVWSPFQLVLVWVWERFLKLRPQPNLIRNGEPRMARWNDRKCNFQKPRLVLDSSKESFVWRPYTKAVENWGFPKFYMEKEMWVSTTSGLDEDLESFIRCLRVSELVGIEADCVEQYLPHRVARQFGIDQDIPDFVARSCESRVDAWSCYSVPLSDMKCYIPSLLSETDVTTRYLEWWKHSVLDQQGANKSVLHQQKNSECLTKKPKLLKKQQMTQNFVSSFKISRKTLKRKKAVNDLQSFTVSTMSSMKYKKISSFKITPKNSNGTKEGEILTSSFKMIPKSGKEKEGSGDDTNRSYNLDSQSLKRKNKDDISVALRIIEKKTKNLSSVKKNKENDKYASPEYSSVSAKTISEINSISVPPGFHPKRNNRIEDEDSSDEDGLTIAQMLKYWNRHDVENRQCGSGKNLLGKQQGHLSLVADEEATKTSVLATSVKQVLSSEAAKNGQGCSNKSVSGPYVIQSSQTGTIVDLTLMDDLELVEAAVEDGQGNNDKHASRPYVIHSSSSDDDEPQTVADQTSVENLKLREATETRQDENCENASGKLSQYQCPLSSTAGNGGLEVSHLVTSMETVKLNAPSEKSQDSDGENSTNPSGQSQSHPSSVAGSETPKTLEAEAISAENVMLTETGLKQVVEDANESGVGSPAHKTDSGSGNKEGSSGYPLGEPIMKLEDQIRRLEKIVAEYKAVLLRRRYAEPSL